MKVKSLMIENFKCFDRLKIDFKPITILAGGNACGKSSVIQMLRYLQRIDNDKSRVSTSIDQFDYGAANSIIYENSSNNFIKVNLVMGNELEKIFTFSLNDNDLYSFNVSTNGGRSFHKLYNLYYLSAERKAPISLHEVKDSSGLYVGARGEYAVSVFAFLSIMHKQRSKYSLQLKKLFSNQLYKSEVKGYEALCNYWINEIVGPTHIFVSGVEEVPYNKLAIKNQGEVRIPEATGFGISYCLPIVIQGLACALLKNSLFIVENPEVHLHPKSQSRMGAFLAYLASEGVQVIVETHSEHIINGARLFFARYKLEQIMNIIFFDNKDNNFIQKEIFVNKFGELSEWPEDFFDQTEKDLTEILKRKIVDEPN